MGCLQKLAHGYADSHAVKMVCGVLRQGNIGFSRSTLTRVLRVNRSMSLGGVKVDAADKDELWKLLVRWSVSLPEMNGGVFVS
jgi:hypothetical protein